MTGSDRSRDPWSTRRGRRSVLAGGVALTTVLTGCTSFQSATGISDSGSSDSGSESGTGTPGGGEWTNEGLVVATSEASSLNNGLRISLTVRSTDQFTRVRTIGYAYDQYNSLLGQTRKVFDDVGEETIDVTLDIAGFDPAYAQTFDTDVTGEPAGFIEGLF